MGVLFTGVYCRGGGGGRRGQVAIGNEHGSPDLFPATYRPLQDDAGLVNGFVVGDVGAVDGPLGGPPNHHRVGL